MSDEKALLAAVWAEPHDDTPRLAYADFLQEAGGEANAARAEYIRVQCELARLDEDDPRRKSLETRERALARKYRRDWNEGLPKPLTRARFVRGFVYPRMRGILASQFLALKPNDLAPAPLWSFRIESGHKRWEAVADSPSLRRVDHLDYGHNLLDEPSAVRLLSSIQMVNVSTLGLGLSRFTPPAMAALADNDALAHLATLAFGGNHMTDEVFAPLAGSRRLATVRALDLTQNNVSAVSVRVLADSPHAARLRSLDFFGTPIGDDGVRALCRSGWRLRSLSLAAVGMTDASAADLADWPGLRSLRFLTLGANQLTPQTAKVLAASPHFADGVVISLWTTPLEADRAAQKIMRDRFGAGAHFFHHPR
jgi:uncharacterized protein (TIGR02996 family)